MGRMTTFWTFIVPGWFAFSGISKATELGPVWTVIISAFWLFIFLFAWQIRRLFKLLMSAQDVRDEVGYLELVERKKRAERRAARRERAEARLARIHQDAEQRAVDETVEDLVELHHELDSDTDIPEADT